MTDEIITLNDIVSYLKITEKNSLAIEGLL